MESFTPTDVITPRSNLFSSSKFERTSGIKTKRKKKEKEKKWDIGGQLSPISLWVLNS